MPCQIKALAGCARLLQVAVRAGWPAVGPRHLSKIQVGTASQPRSTRLYLFHAASALSKGGAACAGSSLPPACAQWRPLLEHAKP